MLQKGKVFQKHISRGNKTVCFPASWEPLDKLFSFPGTYLVLLFSIETRKTNHNPLPGVVRIRCLEHSQGLPYGC